MSESPADRRRGYGAVFARGEFRWLRLADGQSLLGDQLARVALTVLVYERTRSGLASAAVYAATFVPVLAGGVLLGPLADRMPRRTLLVVGDAIRAEVLVELMPLRSVPPGVVVALLIVVVLIGGPWKATGSALVADIVRGDNYVVSVGLRTATLQRELRDRDAVGRFGGEEFAAVLAGAGADEAATVAERVCAAVRGTRRRGVGHRIGRRRSSPRRARRGHRGSPARQRRRRAPRRHAARPQSGSRQRPPAIT